MFELIKLSVKSVSTSAPLQPLRSDHYHVVLTKLLYLNIFAYDLGRGGGKTGVFSVLYPLARLWCLFVDHMASRRKTRSLSRHVPIRNIWLRNGRLYCTGAFCGGSYALAAGMRIAIKAPWFTLESTLLFMFFKQAFVEKPLLYAVILSPVGEAVIIVASYAHPVL